MPRNLDRDEVREMAEQHHAQIVEVLPRDAYDWAHLPGAQHLPLEDLTLEVVTGCLDRDRPVVAYCNDFP